ncbi:UNVERIFIED_CONTAM: hypothetical protein HDU68_008858 [Siphonaria sp. JEL0065]|nr:hypothetical protein HDU68_008858 [Siphonaria sp. JEL0065]
MAAALILLPSFLSVVSAAPVADTPVARGATWYTPPQNFQWQWQIDQATIPRIAPDVFANGTQVDLLIYDVDIEESAAEIAKIKSWGAKVACYFEAGTWVDRRPWSSLYPKSALGFPYEAPYTDELWVNPSDPAIRDIIKNTIYPYAKARGCDMVEPDNVQGFETDSYCTGWEATIGPNCVACKSGSTREYFIDKKCDADYNAWLEFNKFLATEAHNQGLGVALKNNHFQAAQLVDYHDFVLSEQCTSYYCTYSNKTVIGSDIFGATANDCVGYLPFLKAGKAVALTEYQSTKMTINALCKAASAFTPYGGFNSILKKPALGATPRAACCGDVPCGAGVTTTTTTTKKTTTTTTKKTTTTTTTKKATTTKV